MATHQPLQQIIFEARTPLEKDLYDSLTDNLDRLALWHWAEYLRVPGRRKMVGHTLLDHWNDTKKRARWRKQQEGKALLASPLTRPLFPDDPNDMAFDGNPRESENDDESPGYSGDDYQGEDYQGELSPTWHLAYPRRNSRGESIAPISPTDGEMRFIARNLRGKWRFAKSLYQTHIHQMGKPKRIVWLFVKLGQQNEVVDRVVVKQIWIKSGAPLGGHQPDQSESRARNEIRINRFIASTQCSHMAAHRGSARRERKLLIAEGRGDTNNNEDGRDTMPPPMPPINYDATCFYLFTDYYPEGDLKGLIKAQNSPSDPVLLAPAGHRPIPEHYIWFLLGCLVEALLTLHDGKCEEPKDPIEQEKIYEKPKEWKPLVHNDIKDENIFLGNADSVYPSYSRPLLADFDLVNPVARGGINRKSKHSGTQNWMPPEKVIESLSLGKTLDFESDLWAVGMLACKLMFFAQDQRAQTGNLRDEWHRLLHEHIES